MAFLAKRAQRAPDEPKKTVRFVKHARLTGMTMTQTGGLVGYENEAVCCARHCFIVLNSVRVLTRFSEAQMLTM